MSLDYSIMRLCAYVYAFAPALFLIGASSFLLWLDRRRRHREAAELRARRKREEEREQWKIGERIMREMGLPPRRAALADPLKSGSRSLGRLPGFSPVLRRKRSLQN